MSNQSLIDRLNAALAEEYTAIIQYNTYAARVTGPHRLELVEFFQKEIPDETGHARFLADKIVALGGIPVTTANPVPEASDPRQMLEYVVEAEKRAVKAYAELAEMAEAAGERGLAIGLEDLIVDETGHKEATERVLSNWR